MPRVITARYFTIPALFYVLFGEDNTVFAITELNEDGSGAGEYHSAHEGRICQVCAVPNELLVLYRGLPPAIVGYYPNIYRMPDDSIIFVAQLHDWALPPIRNAGDLRHDYSNRAVVWYNESWSTDNTRLVCSVSALYATDGVTFNEIPIVVQDPPFFYTAEYIEIAPLHDGVRAYLMWRAASGAGYAQVSLLDTTGTVVGSILFSWDFTVDIVQWLSVSNVNDDLVFALSHDFPSNPYTYTLRSVEFSTATVTSLQTFVMPTSTARIRHFTTTPSGTLIILESDEDSNGAMYMTLWRSIDLGATFDEIDLTASMGPGISGGGIFNEQIAVNGDGVVLIALYDGTVIFSKDDGATWIKSNVFLPIDWATSSTGTDS